jgi:hypothetical protein
MPASIQRQSHGRGSRTPSNSDIRIPILISRRMYQTAAIAERISAGVTGSASGAIAGRASSVVRARTINGMPMTWVRTLRRSMWYSRYFASCRARALSVVIQLPYTLTRVAQNRRHDPHRLPPSPPPCCHPLCQAREIRGRTVFHVFHISSHAAARRVAFTLPIRAFSPRRALVRRTDHMSASVQISMAGFPPGATTPLPAAFHARPHAIRRAPVQASGRMGSSALWPAHSQSREVRRKDPGTYPVAGKNVK